MVPKLHGTYSSEMVRSESSWVSLQIHRISLWGWHLNTCIASSPLPDPEGAVQMGTSGEGYTSTSRIPQMPGYCRAAGSCCRTSLAYRDTPSSHHQLYLELPRCPEHLIASCSGSLLLYLLYMDEVSCFRQF